MSIDVTVFTPPNGECSVIQMQSIRLEDEEWFKANNAKLSMEDIGGGMIAVYADFGLVDDGEPNEAIELSRGRSCEDTMHALRIMAAQMLENGS